MSRRKQILAAPFPAAWEKIIELNVELYRHLPQSLKGQLHDDIKIFLDEKEFEGCGGLEITDEIRLTVAAEACLLLLNRKNSDFPKLNSILMYPHPYVARKVSAVGGHYVYEPSTRAGESWTGGDVVLAWDCVKHGAINGKDGHNVVLHEFAHQLDQEDGRADGAPILEKTSRYASWARVLSREYEQLRDDAAHHRKSILDHYGATNPAEFFAVATEAFFEKPKQLKRKETELYEELRHYYKLDPVAWM